MADLIEIDKQLMADFQTDNLGILKCGIFTGGVMLDIEPLLSANPQVSDSELVRAIMRSIARLQPSGEEREGRELSEEEALQITDADVERFAEVFLKRERNIIGQDEVQSSSSAVSALASYVRGLYDKTIQSIIELKLKR